MIKLAKKPGMISLGATSCFRLLGLSLLIFPWSPVQSGELTLTTGLDISSGKYGDPDSTIVRYLPFTMKYEHDRSTVKLTLPYLSVTSHDAGQRITQSGHGDAVASYSYSVVDQPRYGWLVDLTAKAKLPTADKTKFLLSNGEPVFTVLADFYYPVGKWTPFLTLGYRMPGDPPGLKKPNIWQGTLGLAYKHSKTDSAGFLIDIGGVSDTNAQSGSTASTVGSRELTTYWVHKFTPTTKVQVYLVKGFSDASADYGVGAMVSHKY